jgi:hypothetical protein
MPEYCDNERPVFGSREAITGIRSGGLTFTQSDTFGVADRIGSYLTDNNVVFAVKRSPVTCEDVLNMGIKELRGCHVTHELIYDICKRIKSLEQSEKHSGDYV